MAQISYTIFIHMLNLFEMSFLNTSRIFENFFLLKNIHGFAHLKAKEGRKEKRGKLCTCSSSNLQTLQQY